MRRPGVLLALLAIVMIHAVLLWIYYSPAPKEPTGDEGMYLEVAGRIQAGEDPGLERLWPPLYPRFVAEVLSPRGGPPATLQVVQTLLLVAVAFLLRDICRRLVGPGRVGDLVLLFTLAYPPLVAYAHYVWPEVLHLVLMVGATWILVARRDRLPWLAGLGLLLGLSLLTKSLLGPFLPALLLPLALEGSARQRWARVSLVVVVLGTTVAPTLIANHRASGRLGIADSGRFNLWVGLNDRSRRNFVGEIVGREFQRYRASAEDPGERNAILDRKTARLLRERGLLRVLGDQLGRQYFRLFDKNSFLTDQLPGGVIHAQGRGYRGSAGPLASAVRYLSFTAYAAILLLATAAIWLWPPRGRWVWLAMGFVAYNLALFLVLHVKTRYRIQFLPVLFVYAAIAVDRLLGEGAKLRDRSPRVLVGTGITGALLMFLAFGGSLLD